MYILLLKSFMPNGLNLRGLQEFLILFFTEKWLHFLFYDLKTVPLFSVCWSLAPLLYYWFIYQMTEETLLSKETTWCIIVSQFNFFFFLQLAKVKKDFFIFFIIIFLKLVHSIIEFRGIIRILNHRWVNLLLI